MVESSRTDCPESTKRGSSVDPHARSYNASPRTPRLHHEVIGVGLVVDQGEGPRLALRYPWADGPGGVHFGGESSLGRAPTVFDRLAPDSFARVFRPAKPCLCGRVLHVEIDGVNFISNPILSPSDELEYFNIVVAVKTEINPSEDRVVAPGPGAAAAAAGAAAAAAAAPAPAPGSSPPNKPKGLSTPPPDGVHGAGNADASRKSGREMDCAAESRGDWCLLVRKARGPGIDLARVAKAVSLLSTKFVHEEKRCKYVSKEARELEDFHADITPEGATGSGGLNDHHFQLPRARGSRGSGVIGTGGGTPGGRGQRGVLNRRWSSCASSNAGMGAYHSASLSTVTIPEDRGRSAHEGNGSFGLSYGRDALWNRSRKSGMEGGGGGGAGGFARRNGDGQGQGVAPGQIRQESIHEMYERELMERSQLARDLRAVYEGFTGKGVPEVQINYLGKVNLMVSVREQKPPFQKYETIMLLEDVATLLAMDKLTPQLRTVIKVASPLRTLQEISKQTQILLPQLYRFTKALVLWGHARVIDTISMANRYQCKRESLTLLASPSPLVTEFAVAFPSRNLFKELERFGSRRPISDIMSPGDKPQQSSLLQVLIWLLRKDFLIQLGHYITLRIREPARSGSVCSAIYVSSCGGGAGGVGVGVGGGGGGGSVNGRKMSTGSAGGTSGARSWEAGGFDNSFSSAGSLSTICTMVGDRAGGRGATCGGEPPLEAFEEDYLRQEDDGSETCKLMWRLAPYLRGQLRMREIMWHLEINDKQMVDNVLKRYSNILAESWRPLEKDSNGQRKFSKSAGDALTQISGG